MKLTDFMAAMGFLFIGITVAVALLKNEGTLAAEKARKSMKKENEKPKDAPAEEGEATVQSSSLLHGVTRMSGGGVRYSLIMFFAPAGG